MKYFDPAFQLDDRLPVAEGEGMDYISPNTIQMVLQQHLEELLPVLMQLEPRERDFLILTEYCGLTQKMVSKLFKLANYQGHERAMKHLAAVLRHDALPTRASRVKPLCVVDVIQDPDEPLKVS